jgi:hypothetical protein
MIIELAPQQEGVELAAQIMPLYKQTRAYEAEAWAILADNAQRVRQTAQEMMGIPKLRTVGRRLQRTARYLERIAGELAREVME